MSLNGAASMSLAEGSALDKLQVVHRIPDGVKTTGKCCELCLKTVTYYRVTVVYKLTAKHFGTEVCSKYCSFSSIVPALVAASSWRPDICPNIRSFSNTAINCPVRPNCNVMGL